MEVKRNETPWNMSYTYDTNSRLATESSTQFAYDWVGNRTTPGDMVYNAADQLVEWPGEHVYGYDSAGNLTYEYDSSGQTLQKTYAYSPAGLLESVVHAGVQNPSEMTWDADGNRVSFTSSTSGTWQFVYDVTAGIPAVIEETGPVYYIREPNGALIARVDGETVNYYHFDALGSTRLLTNASGAVTDEYTYDAWGNLTDHTQHEGSVSQPYQFVGQLGYYTHVQDANLPLLQLGVRMYDPEIGRFTQVDKADDDGNSYAYVSGNPVVLTDPPGLTSYWDDEREYLACVKDCLLTYYSLPGGAAGAGTFIGKCFRYGKWIGLARGCQAAKAAAKGMFRPTGGLSVAGQVCLLAVGAALLSCEGYCYWKLLH